MQVAIKRPGHGSVTVTTSWSHYAETGETSLQLWFFDEPWATVTVCPYPPAEPADADHLWVRCSDMYQGYPQALADAGIVTLKSDDVIEGQGHVPAYCRLCELTTEAKAEIEATYAKDSAMRADRERLRAARRRAA